MLVHILIALDGQFGGLGQVTVDVDERVNGVDVGRLVVLHVAHHTVLAGYLQGRHHRSTALAGLAVVVVQGLEVFQFIADDAEHIVVEQLAVAPDGGQRLVVGSLHGGQSFTGLGVERHRQLVLLFQLAVVVVNLLQHGGIDGGQGLVGRRPVALLHPLDGGLQRVGGNICHRPAASQFGCHQLSVFALLLGLFDNLHQHIVLRAGQVFLLCLVHLFPQGRICLSE